LIPVTLRKWIMTALAADPESVLNRVYNCV
jgi:hypothetical protein